MGVFARFRRKSSDVAGETVTTGDAASGAAESAPDTEEVTPAEGGADDGAGAAEGVDIPKQQTADEAADNGAGESART
ncbi:hypothetical protein OG875_06485 [Streptomyces sp. NBC_01498]|uniref:hypothetical protein n=1 Tax=Streptomyces sp. NBC_01498 TaxID=2975870 RepID=UPI002E7C2EC8|nr:hypothetical protein [Streptomyces sp. NBC_01498]WTL24288.1 hypothetical protein OG875_06485 [Streptomyces sp. NBC_01498]